MLKQPPRNANPNRERGEAALLLLEVAATQILESSYGDEANAAKLARICADYLVHEVVKAGGIR